MVSAFAGQKRTGLRFGQIGQDKRNPWTKETNLNDIIWETRRPSSEGGRYKSEVYGQPNYSD